MPGASSDDLALVAALRAGDEMAFAQLVRMYDPMLRRVARNYVSTDAVAAEVVQDTWLAVIEGLDRFEGRSSLRTWIVRILMNQARTRGVREKRTVPFSSVGPADDDLGGFDPDRFQRTGATARAWAQPPSDWATLPAERLEAAETRDVVRSAIDSLPDQQRTVISLRDVEGWSSAEVRDALDLSEVNQRVLLHRARGSVRKALDAYLGASR
jgi:RNA polymerase sigma-70 factor (ECF subfamily)